METSDVLLIAALVLVPAAILWGVFLMRTGRSRRSPAAQLGIPHALRPGQPDDVLEGPRLSRLQGAGFVAALAAALFIPLYWFPEPDRQEAFAERFAEDGVERGSIIYRPAPQLEEDIDPLEFKEQEHAIALGMGCANCHGGLAEDPENPGHFLPEGSAGGGFANPPGRDPVTGDIVAWVAPPLNTVFQRWDEEIIRFTIERGRPGTPMPTWGQEYGGPMTAQMVDDVVAFLRSIQVTQRDANGVIAGEDYELDENADGQEIFEARCAVCHGPEGQGKEDAQVVDIPVGTDPEDFPTGPVYYPGLALWKGDVAHLPENMHLFTIRNGRRFAFMPAFAEAPSQGIPVPAHPLTDEQIEAVLEYERTL